MSASQVIRELWQDRWYGNVVDAIERGVKNIHIHTYSFGLDQESRLMSSKTKTITESHITLKTNFIF